MTETPKQKREREDRENSHIVMAITEALGSSRLELLQNVGRHEMKALLGVRMAAHDHA